MRRTAIFRRKIARDPGDARRGRKGNDMTDPALRLAGVRKSYNRGRPNEIAVLDGISLGYANMAT